MSYQKLQMLQIQTSGLIGKDDIIQMMKSSVKEEVTHSEIIKHFNDGFSQVSSGTLTKLMCQLRLEGVVASRLRGTRQFYSLKRKTAYEDPKVSVNDAANLIRSFVHAMSECVQYPNSAVKDRNFECAAKNVFRALVGRDPDPEEYEEMMK